MCFDSSRFSQKSLWGEEVYLSLVHTLVCWSAGYYRFLEKKLHFDTCSGRLLYFFYKISGNVWKTQTLNLLGTIYEVCFLIYVFVYLPQVFPINTLLEFSDFLLKARVLSNLKCEGPWFFENKMVWGLLAKWSSKW